MWVPIDDATTMVYNWDYLPEGREDATGHRTPRTDAAWFRDARLEMGTGNAFGTEVDPVTFRSLQNRGNRYLIDRRVQKTRTYTGIPGINVQDRAVQESMGAIADRSLERLGTTDRAIITTRRLLLNAIAAVERGDGPAGVSASYYELRPGEKVLPKNASWMEAFGLIEAIETPVS
jgi:hypothetical protein